MKDKTIVLISPRVLGAEGQIRKAPPPFGIASLAATLIKKGYELLELETFFTSGPEESRAWTVSINCTAPKAAGIIHTDFEKGFIRAETVSYKEIETTIPVGMLDIQIPIDQFIVKLDLGYFKNKNFYHYQYS